jgi:hypothetical protein
MYKICLLILFSLNGISQLKVIKTEKYKRSPNEVTVVGVLGSPIENNKKSRIEYTNLQYTVNGTDTTFTLLFTDNSLVLNKKNDFLNQSVSFHAKNNALNGFYKILKSFFKKENQKNKGYSVTFILGNKEIKVDYSLHYSKGQLGPDINSITLFIKKNGEENSTSSFFNLNDKEIDQLFGKKSKVK